MRIVGGEEFLKYMGAIFTAMILVSIVIWTTGCTLVSEAVPYADKEPNPTVEHLLENNPDACNEIVSGFNSLVVVLTVEGHNDPEERAYELMVRQAKADLRATGESDEEHLIEPLLDKCLEGLR